MAEPGQTVLRVIKRVDMARTSADGQYVVEYDPALTPLGGAIPNPRDRRDIEATFKLVTSPNIKEARGFPSVVEAMRYLRQVCPNQPFRDDGEPNRPLTAFTIELAEAPTC